MNAVNELLGKCKARGDGDWETLAAAAGDEGALAKTERGLSADVLSQAFRGAAVSPMRVQWRVEALSCRRFERLQSLASSWPRPSALDAMSGGANAFFVRAWNASLRHLYKHKAVVRAEVDAPALEQEVETVWPGASSLPVSWASIVAEYGKRYMSAEEIRRLANNPLEDRLLTGSDIEWCAHISREQVRDDVTLHRSPFYILRLLRGKAAVLDSTGREKIAKWNEELDRFDPVEQAVLIELGIELGLGIRDTAAAQLLRRLSQDDDPVSAYWPVLVVFGKNWQSP